MTLLMIGAPEIICIILIVLLLFGAKKIPELMKSMGRGVRFFKQGMNDIEEEVNRPLDKQHPSQSATEEAPKKDGE